VLRALPVLTLRHYFHHNNTVTPFYKLKMSLSDFKYVLYLCTAFEDTLIRECGANRMFATTPLKDIARRQWRAIRFSSNMARRPGDLL
jgi:hypothetical protein